MVQASGNGLRLPTGRTDSLQLARRELGFGENCGFTDRSAQERVLTDYEALSIHHFDFEMSARRKGVCDGFVSRRSIGRDWRVVREKSNHGSAAAVGASDSADANECVHGHRDYRPIRFAGEC